MMKKRTKLPITRRELHDALIVLRTSVVNDIPHTYKKNMGICGNLQRIFYSMGIDVEQYDEYPCDLVMKYGKKWPERVKNCPEYPVPAPVGGGYSYTNPISAFCDFKNKWAGEYGESRMRLLKYLIKETR
jgi:hypothetical protein